MLPVLALLHYVATLVDEARNACVCGTRYAAAGLYGTQLGELQMLTVSGTVAPPAIVGDDKQQVGSFSDKLSDISSKHRLVTNKSTYLVAVKRQNPGLIVFLEGSHRTS